MRSPVLVSCLVSVGLLWPASSGCRSEKTPQPAAPTAAPTPADPTSAAIAIASPDAAAVAEAPDAATVEPSTTPDASEPAPTVAQEAGGRSVKTALARAATGCVGTTRDGSRAVIVEDLPADDTVRRVAWVAGVVPGEAAKAVELATCSDADARGAALLAACTATLAKYDDDAIAALTEALEDAPLTGACEAVEPAPRAARTVVEVGGERVPIEVDAEVSVGDVVLARARPDEIEESDATYALVRAYVAPATGAVFTLVRPIAGDEAPPEPPEPELYGVSGAELGVAPCIPRTRLVKREPPVFEAWAPDKDADYDCVTMTKDGARAAFLLSRSDRFADEGGEDGPASLTWLPEGPAPLDLSCLTAECGDADLARIAKGAAELGLQTCATTPGPIFVEGLEATIVSDGDRLWMDVPDFGRRWLHTFTVAAHDGGDHESFDALYQARVGGPVFVRYDNADTGLSETKVLVFADAAALGFCPAK